MKEKHKNIIEAVLLALLVALVALIFSDLLRFQKISLFAKIVAPALALALIGKQLIDSKQGKEKRELTAKKLYISILCGQVVVFIMAAMVFRLQPSGYALLISLWILAIILTPFAVWKILKYY